MARDTGSPGLVVRRGEVSVALPSGTSQVEPGQIVAAITSAERAGYPAWQLVPVSMLALRP